MAISRDYIPFTAGKGVLQSFVTGTLRGICEAVSTHLILHSASAVRVFSPNLGEDQMPQVRGLEPDLTVQHMEVSLRPTGSQGSGVNHEDPALTIWVSICWWRDRQPQSRGCCPCTASRRWLRSLNTTKHTTIL